MNIQLGRKVRDQITGFEGIATQKCDHLYGCTQFGVTPKVDKDGKIQDPRWFDDGRLVDIGPGIEASEVKGSDNGCENQAHP